MENKLKKAYPNNDGSVGSTPQKSYDISKWMNAMKTFYFELHNGKDQSSALNSVAKSWDVVEKNDFSNWLKYYQSGDYLKYKTAQVKPNHKYYMNENMPGYFLPTPQKIKVPEVIKSNEDDINDIIDGNIEPEISEKEKNDQKKFTIEDQRKKLLGRLTSIEKLLASPDGHLFSGLEFETLLKSIYDLKHQIATMNKTSLSHKTYSDIIIRQASRLNNFGFNNSAELLNVLAQNVPSIMTNPTPATSKIDTSVGLNNNNPSNLGKNPPDVSLDIGNKDSKPVVAPAPPAPPDAVSQFLSNLKELKKDNNAVEDGYAKDENEANDSNTKLNKAWTGNLNVLEEELDHYNYADDGEPEYIELLSKAQALPTPAKPPTIVSPPSGGVVKKPTEKLEVSENDLPIKPEGDKQTRDFDIILDQAFANITVGDIINELEEVSAIFKNRELSRKLSVIDLMLSRLGLSSYFEELAEAINKTLDNSSYAGSRIENILSKLRGAISTDGIDLTPDKPNVNPEVKKVEEALKNQEDKEKERKELRKSVENAKLDNSTKEPLSVENPTEELNGTPPKTNPPPVIK